MQRKAHGSQRPRHTVVVGEGVSTALTILHPACRIADCVALLQRSDAPEKRINGSFHHAASFEMSAT